MTITQDKIRKFVQENFKMLVTIFAFLVTMYVQHVTNTGKIDALERHCDNLELKIADQYERIDAIKLDKTVFEATMSQFSSIQSDLREMRADIKELLKTKN